MFGVIWLTALKLTHDGPAQQSSVPAYVRMKKCRVCLRHSRLCSPSASLLFEGAAAGPAASASASAAAAVPERAAPSSALSLLPAPPSASSPLPAATLPAAVLPVVGEPLPTALPGDGPAAAARSLSPLPPPPPAAGLPGLPTLPRDGRLLLPAGELRRSQASETAAKSTSLGSTCPHHVAR